MIPVFIALVLSREVFFQYAALIVFLIAAITDTLDGYVARKYDLVSDFGRFLDPLADKLLVTAALTALVGMGRMSAWAMYIIIVREFSVTGLRLIAVNRGVVIGAGFLGKLKTVVQIVVVSYGMAPFYKDIDNIFKGYSLLDILVFLMVFITVASGVEYIYRHRALLMGDK